MKNTLLPLAIEPHVVGWIVVVQDWTGYARGTTARKKLPPLSTKWFASRGEAERHKAELRAKYPSPDCLITVGPATLKRGKVKEQPKPAHKGSKR